MQQECDLQNAIDVDIASLCKRPNVDQFAAQPPTDLGADEPDDTTTTDGSDEDDALGPRRMSANSRAAFNSNASNPLQPPAFSGFGGPAALPVPVNSRCTAAPHRRIAQLHRTAAHAAL